MIAYILTGGESTRVRELTDAHQCQKHQLPVGGRPFNIWMEEWLGAEEIIDRIIYLNRPVVGTGGALKEEPITNFPYLLVYGDCYSPVDLGPVYYEMLDRKLDMTIITRLTSEPDYGLINVGDMVESYSRHHSELEYRTNIGTYMIDRRAHEYIANQPWRVVEGSYLSTMSLEYHCFNTIFQHLVVGHYDTSDLPYYDVGSVDRYRITEEEYGNLACDEGNVREE